MNEAIDHYKRIRDGFVLREPEHSEVEDESEDSDDTDEDKPIEE